MKITKISEQLKNSNRANVFIDGKYSFSLTLDQLLETKLKVNTEVDDQRIAYLKKISSDGKLKMRTMEWLMIRPRSTKELSDYLKRKQLKKDIANTWINEFTKKGYLNDELFAKWWVEQRRNKQKSSLFIRHELKSKAVSEEIINEALIANDCTDVAMLKTLVAKKRRLVKFQDDKKLTEYLLRQGYRYSSIKEALTE